MVHMHRCTRCLAIVLLLCGLWLANGAPLRQPLRMDQDNPKSRISVLGPKFRVKDVSLVGLSAGAYMAVQYAYAYSSYLIGGGFIAGGPFYCAQGDVDVALSSCMVKPDLIDMAAIFTEAQGCVDTLFCDDPLNLQTHRAYIFSGMVDTVVVQGVVEKTKEFFAAYIPTDSIQTVFNISAEHSWPTQASGNPCSYLGEPFVNQCDYDAAYAAMDWIYQGIASPQPANMSRLVSVPQLDYTPDGVAPVDISMGPTAFIYIPDACSNGAECRLVIALHGCKQTLQDIGMDFIQHIGLNEVAEANNYIILYPQIIRSPDVPYNPNGCFDWWGYTGEDYSSKAGPQMKTIFNMMASITGNGEWSH